MRNTTKRMAKMGMVLAAGLAAVNACTTADPSEPATESTSSALNATPGVTATSALSAGRERTHGAACAVFDPTNNRFVTVAAFGYRGNITYVNTYEAYDNTPAASWFTNGTVHAGATNATAAAFVDAAVDPNDNTKCYFGGGNDATTVYKQMWQVQVNNHVVTWTKKADMPVNRSHFAFAQCGTTATAKRIMAVSGETTIAPTRTSNIDTYNPAADTWASPATMPEAVFDYGISRVDGNTFAVGGGNGATSNPTAQFVGINANNDCSTVTVTAIKDASNNAVIDARKENAVVFTGRTSTNSAIGGTKAVEFAAIVGWDGTNLVTTADIVVVEFSGASPAYRSNVKNGGTAPATNVRFPTVVDAQAAPANPGIVLINGTNALGTTVTNKVQKWIPSSSGGSFHATTPALNGGRTGVEACYVPPAGDDYIPAISGQDRYPVSGVPTDFTQTDIIR